MYTYPPTEERWADQFILYKTVLEDDDIEMHRVYAISDNIYDLVYYTRQNSELCKSTEDWSIVRGLSKTNVIGKISRLGYVIGIFEDDGSLEETEGVLYK